ALQANWILRCATQRYNQLEAHRPSLTRNDRTLPHVRTIGSFDAPEYSGSTTQYCRAHPCRSAATRPEDRPPGSAPAPDQSSRSNLALSAPTQQPPYAGPAESDEDSVGKPRC